MLAKLYYYIVVLVSVSLLGSQVLADDEPQDKRLFNSSSYKKVYSESSSLFWNNRFNDGQGLISLNLAEIIMFEAFDVTKNPETQGSEVLDIFSGLKFGGVLHEGFLLTFEVNVSNHQVKKKDAKKYNNFRLGMSFETGLLYGISLSQNWTLVAKTSFRVWDYSTDKHPAAPEDVRIIQSNGYLFRAECYIYYEIFNINREYSLNLFVGLGSHYYRASEPALETDYQPRRILDTDLIIGYSFIFDKNYEIYFGVYIFGVFTIYLNFAYYT